MSEAAAPPSPGSSVPRRRRWRRVLVFVLLLIFLPIVFFSWVVYSTVRASLPMQTGEVRVPGLKAELRIERDAQGVPTLHAASKGDLAVGLGFLHGQERFFQMDLLRRAAAGELSELLGPDEGRLVELDRTHRVHRFRHRAKLAVERLTPAEKAHLEGYVSGVNAGLKQLTGKPFEYLLLGSEPAPWQPEDCFLMVAAMYLQLHPQIWAKESTYAAVDDLYPTPMAQWLGWPSDEWDTPLEGGPLPRPPLPTSEEFDLRREGKTDPNRPRALRLGPDWWNEGVALGSNNWAVAGSRSKVGAILCNDMHLALRLPNVWYRVCMKWPDEKNPQEQRRAVGVTLPGGPVLVVGSNGHVAWGYTNAVGDWADLILLESPEKADPNVYKTPAGPRLYDVHVETLKIKGYPDEQLKVFETMWGPVFDGDHRKRQRVLRWVAHDPEGLNLRMTDLIEARSVEEALAIANRCGSPHQNFLCADRAGRIGWTILGRVPVRTGFDGRLPRSWADGSRKWSGYLPPEQTPRIVDPVDGFLFTANARVVDGANLAKLGFGDYDRGARARQIRDGLRAANPADYDAMLAIHNDDRAVFLERWRRLLLDLLAEPVVSQSPPRRLYRQRVESGELRATPDSVAFRLVFDFRERVQAKVLASLTARCKAADPQFEPRRLPQPEGILWDLLQKKPAHLLEPAFPSWDALLLAVVDEQLKELTPDDPDLTRSTWGQVNTAKIRHPMAGVAGFVTRWQLEAPADQLRGCPRDMPRIASPAMGASQRLAVSPGREEEGYFHMPGGQSGHPWSAYFLAGHEAWVKGEKTPLLPGPKVAEITLQPAP